MPMKLEIEACVERIEDALAAEAAGATRIEINSALALDGLTPSIGVVEQLTTACQLPIIAMLRPHSYGFVYTAAERLALLRDGELLLAAGADGIAFGGLVRQGDVELRRGGWQGAGQLERESWQLDVDLLQQVVKLCGAKDLVMHRAFDELADQRVGLQQLVDCGVRRVLTSGGAASAELGIERLRDLVEWSSGRIEILPGGGVNSGNARALLEATGCSQVHGTFRKRDSKRIEVDSNEIRQLILRLKSKPLA